MNDSTTQSRYELRVVTGLHQGAALPLLDEQVTVGSREDCDIILLDEDVQPCHLTLICAANGRWMNAADHQQIELGKLIAIGQAAIMICDIGSPWKPADSIDALSSTTRESSTSSRPGWLVMHPLAFRLLCVVLAFLCLSSISFFYIYSSSPVAPKTAIRQKQIHVSQIPAPELLEQQVQRLFKDHGIYDLVQLSFFDKRIHIEGVLSPSELQRVNSVVNEIHQEWGDGVKVELKAQPLQLSLPFEIKEVLYGPVPNITLSDGARLFVGDSYLGVRLSEIRPGLMVFNGKRKIEVTW